MGVRRDRARAAQRFCRSRVEKLIIFSDMDNQRVRILISKGSRTDMLLEMHHSGLRQCIYICSTSFHPWNAPAVYFASFSSHSLEISTSQVVG